MNRMEEYKTLLEELEQPVLALSGTYERGVQRKQRKRLFYQPFIGLAAAFALFVILVNASTAAAYACSRVPFLRELAEAVTFSKSLSDAVNHEYVQQMDLVQQDGEVSAKIEYLIVDQKQVNVFYRLYSKTYESMNADPKVLDAKGDSPLPCSYTTNGWDLANGELNSVTIDFVNHNVPDRLRLRLDVRDMEWKQAQNLTAPEQADEKELFDPSGPDERSYVAHFDFLLEFDPLFTAAGKEYSVHKTVTLEGQKITITDVGIYPTYMNIRIADDPENTAWLKHLYFYVVTDQGRIFEAASSGITATGSGETPTMNAFRADSTWFYEAEELKLVITGARWLRKDMERLYINLETGETGELPEGVEFESAEKRNGGWILKLQASYQEEKHHYQILASKFYDAEGNAYDIRSWGTYSRFQEGEEEQSSFIEEVPLADYHEKEVWVAPQFSHEWTAEEPVEVVIRGAE